MPPRVALGAGAARQIRREPYVCSSCLLKDAWRYSSPARSKHNVPLSTTSASRSQRPRSNELRRLTHTRQVRTYTSNGSLASTTAVNAPSTVPHELRELHQRLQLLQDKASSYVDLSRLQLALRSLESKDPIIRIAFLGLGSNGVRAARKLAKVLLADELGEEADWERQLLNVDAGTSLLLKNGEVEQDAGVQGGGSSMVQELRINSPRLKRWNMEILVTGLNAAGYRPSDTADGSKQLEESILVPPVTIPNAGGRVGFVRYPVHKALVVADGISGAVEYGRLPSSIADGKLISAALSLPLNAVNSKVTSNDASHASTVSIDLAEQALNLFRASNANGAIYSEQWQQSRLGRISTWLSAASQPSEDSTHVKPAVDDLLSSVIVRTQDAIISAENSTEASSLAVTVSESRRSSLLSAIAVWSEEAHRDLQMNLSTALLSLTWRRTTWWRLFWRIDEVSIAAGDVLRRGWLVEAEQSLAFLSGRILEAGLASVKELKGESTSTSGAPSSSSSGLLNEMMDQEISEYKATKSEGAQQQQIGTIAELMQLPPMLAKVRDETGLNALFDPPWPQTIHLARQQMLYQRVPSMHRKAQAYMLASLSTIGGSGALGGWLWVASGGVALYEAGAITALGLVWALRRLQKKWSQERGSFTDAAREDARRVLADVESRLKKLVQDGGRVKIRDEDRREWRDARAAVDACLEAKRAHDKLV